VFPGGKGKKSPDSFGKALLPFFFVSPGVRGMLWGMVLLLCLTGCTTFSRRPINRVVKAVSIETRMQNWNNTNNNAGPDVLWLKQFCGELKSMDGWAPPQKWFNDPGYFATNLNRVITAEHLPVPPYATNNESLSNLTSELRNASSYFTLSDAVDEIGLTNFVSTDPKTTNYIFAVGITNTPTTNDLPLLGKLNMARLAADMLLRIDQENQRIFTDKAEAFYDRGLRTFSDSPQMVSSVYPVGVSIAVVNPPAATSPATPANTNAQTQITINNYVGGLTNSTSTAIVAGSNTNKSAATADPLDFSPSQNVTLSLSTVLNSADVLDRIEYVSTFIYIYPYPGEPNGGVSINDELWKQFWWRQIPKADPDERANDVCADIASSLDSLRVRFRNITTTVLLKDLTLGTVTRGTEDDLIANLAATIPVPPATVSPSLNATSKVTSSTSLSLLRELDQRSAYVSSDGAFLRITQRGMSSVNLNGRFNEDVQLTIPQAADPFYVLEPVTNNPPEKLGFKLKALGQPVYSHVDAVVVSVAVVRHPTKLRRSNYETFGLPLEDAADEDFIVGLPHPSKVQLWNWSRQVSRVFVSDLDPQSTKTNTVYFDCPSVGLYEPQILRLGGFTAEQSAAFLGRIANAIRCGFGTNIFNNPLVNNLTVFTNSPNMNGPTNCIYVNDATDNITIRLGLLDNQNGPNRLKGFPSYSGYFPSYGKL
jgi:hypothetical protein